MSVIHWLCSSTQQQPISQRENILRGATERFSFPEPPSQNYVNVIWTDIVALCHKLFAIFVFYPLHIVQCHWSMNKNCSLRKTVKPWVRPCWYFSTTLPQAEECLPWRFWLMLIHKRIWGEPIVCQSLNIHMWPGFWVNVKTNVCQHSIWDCTANTVFAYSG